MWSKVVESGGQWLVVGQSSSNWATSQKDTKVGRLRGDLAIWGNRFHRFGAQPQGSRSFQPRAQGESRAHESSRKQSGQGGREGSSQDTRRVPRRIKAIRQPVLYHQRKRGDGFYLSNAGMGGD